MVGVKAEAEDQERAVANPVNLVIRKPILARKNNLQIQTSLPLAQDTAPVSSHPLQPSPADTRDADQLHRTVTPPGPAHSPIREADDPSRSFVIDATSLPGLVERVTRAILLDPQLRDTTIREEQPPRYEE
ncbi:hypothetical protein BDY19DRAFT_991301 [Irpex rosettiformis]|uniref:Uncharacterized protein n=1 Tax=Irpex rosettiformis TaxID=378272 RepID=A0ACB8UB35_9APHY|nr:hypothetical protein BDY19DRAFT_991301 [Irpex rosettiformis]